MSVYLDASFFIALQIQSHTHHEIALGKLSKSPPVKMLVSPLTIDEIMHVLGKHGMSKTSIINALNERLFRIPFVEVIEINWTKALLKQMLKMWQNNQLKPRDNYHLFYMKQHKISKIATFDKDFISHQKSLKIEIL